jgi:DNA polymerase I-like protein with 3'-5' exonuclease and polymerase domains
VLYDISCGEHPGKLDPLMFTKPKEPPMLIELGNYRADFQPWRPACGRVFTTRFAFDTETTPIVGHEPPDYVLGAATDGSRGVFLTPDVVADFLIAHEGAEVVLHRCAFDLAVLHRLFTAQGRSLDVYKLVDERRVYDTMILHKLHGLATLGHAHQGRGQSTLARSVSLFLAVELPKEVRDPDGDDVRTSWGKWLGKPPRDIPAVCLGYVAADVLGTWGIFDHLERALVDVVRDAHDAFGYVDDDWLCEMMRRHGVQTHRLQAQAAVALDQIERVGIGVDLANRNEIVAKVRELVDDLKEELRQFGYLAGEKGCDKTLQALVRQTLTEHPEIEIPRTPTGKYSSKDEDLDQLAQVSEFFARFKDYKQVDALLTNYLLKMDAARLHPHYDLLKVTGRTSASSPNIQNIPRKRKKKKPGARDAFDLRRCFVPAPGTLFYVADYSGLELRTLSQALITQFGLDPVLARKVNEGVDLHRFVAARMKLTGRADAAAILADEHRYAELMASLSDEERGGSKPANFGLPSGMGPPALAAYARAQYEQPYTEEDAAGWKEAWLASFPEMHEFLKDRVDFGLLAARELGLTPGDYTAATGRRNLDRPDLQGVPAGWLGWMAVRTAREERPFTNGGREYTDEELDYFWGKLSVLADRLSPPRREDLRNRRAGLPLYFEVRKLLNRVGAFTITGRLRSKATYTERRNLLFQGPASDGAKLALYRLWRSGLKVVAFIHDEVAVEVDEAADLAAVKARIDGILIDAMKEICPDMTIEVEGTFRRRWGKNKEDEVPVPAREDPDPRYDPLTKELLGGDAQPAA